MEYSPYQETWEELGSRVNPLLDPNVHVKPSFDVFAPPEDILSAEQIAHAVRIERFGRRQAPHFVSNIRRIRRG